MPFSEVVYQCYHKECDDKEELEEFKFMGAHNIINNAYLEPVNDKGKLRTNSASGPTKTTRTPSSPFSAAPSSYSSLEC